MAALDMVIDASPVNSLYRVHRVCFPVQAPFSFAPLDGSLITVMARARNDPPRRGKTAPCRAWRYQQKPQDQSIRAMKPFLILCSYRRSWKNHRRWHLNGFLPANDAVVW